MAFYQKTLSTAWSGRIDGTEPDVLRWHQIMHIVEPEHLPKLMPGEQGIAFVGFCCDEGIRRNNGRIGAAKGPDSLRKACCNFPAIADHIKMADAGDIISDGPELEEAQYLLASKILQIRAAGYLPIVLGGGHELAFGSYMGLKPFGKKSSFGIINFDAHFDLRMPEEGIGATSGSWVYEIANECTSQNIPFEYLAMGIQQYSNTRRLFDLADEMGYPYFLAEHFTNDQLGKILNTINGVLANSDTVLLSIDLDVFGSSYAPGVSASSYNGISPNAMFKRLVRHIVLSGKVAVVDIAELNPLFDVDHRTARLGAAFLFDIVQAADINAEYPR